MSSGPNRRAKDGNRHPPEPRGDRGPPEGWDSIRGSTSAEARMRLVRFSTAGGPPPPGAGLGRGGHWGKIVDLSAGDFAIPADTLTFIDACPGVTGDVWDRALRVLAEAGKIESDAPPLAFR